jgi:hypothetical protein
VDIRKQWERLMVIASRMLRYDLEDKRRTFFNFRHTGASHIAQRGKTPAHLLAVVQMMGDTSVATVNRHYFKMESELMRELVLGWKPGRGRALRRRGRSFRRRALTHLRDRASSRQLTRVEYMPCRNAERDSLTPTQWGALRATESACRECASPAGGSKRSASKRARSSPRSASRVGLLVLTVYEAAPGGRTSPRDASRAIDAQDDALPPRNRA